MILRSSFLAFVFVAALASCAEAPKPAVASPTSAATSATARALPVTWFSLPATDVDKAAAFYRDAFGWEVRPVTKEHDPSYDYRVIVDSPSAPDFTPTERGRVNGCIVKRAIGVETPVVLVEVAHLSEAVAKVVAAGGRVVSEKVPMRSLNGAFVLVKDPEGNLFELFETAPPS